MQYTQQHAIWNIQEEISQLKQLMSDQNLQLLPDYQQRLQVLQDLGFVDADNRIQLKGKVACEVSCLHTLDTPNANPLNSPDPLGRRTRSDGTHLRKRPLLLYTRRNRRSTFRLHLQGKIRH